MLDAVKKRQNKIAARSNTVRKNHGDMICLDVRSVPLDGGLESYFFSSNPAQRASRFRAVDSEGILMFTDE